MNKRITYGFSIGLAIGLIILLLWYAGIEKIWEILSHMNPLWLIPVILIYLMDWILRGFRWKVILRASNIEISIRDSTMLTLVGNMANIVVPAKVGDLARVYGISKLYNAPIPQGVSSVFLDRAFDFFAVLFIIVCILFSGPHLELPNWMVSTIYGSYIIALVLLISIIIVIKNFEIIKTFIANRLKNSKRIKDVVDKLLESIILTVREPYILLIITLVSIVVWSLEALITLVFAISLNIHASFWIIILVILTANLTKTLPLSPGGIGPYEWVFSTLFVAFGLGLAEGTTIGVMDHLFKNVFTIIFGGLAASLLGIKVTKTSAENVSDK